MRDVILAIRADEAHHRVVNHTLRPCRYVNQTHSIPEKKSFEETEAKKLSVSFLMFSLTYV